MKWEFDCRRQHAIRTTYFGGVRQGQEIDFHSAKITLCNAYLWSLTCFPAANEKQLIDVAFRFDVNTWIYFCEILSFIVDRKHNCGLPHGLKCLFSTGLFIFSLCLSEVVSNLDPLRQSSRRQRSIRRSALSLPNYSSWGTLHRQCQDLD